MTDKRKEKRISTKTINTIEYELSDKDDRIFREDLKKRIDEDLRGRLEIQKIIKTPEGYENSLGEVYSFLKSRRICQESCPGKLFSCPKKTKGEQIELTWNKNEGRANLTRVPCSYRKTEISILDRINPCHIKPKSVLIQALLSFFGNTAALAKRQDCAFAFSDFSKKAESLKQSDRIRKGYSFLSATAPKLPLSLLQALCYFGAKKGLTCSYLFRPDLLSSYFSMNGYEAEYSQDDLFRARNTDVLFIEGFEQIPGYFNKQVLGKALLDLFASRDKKGKLTYRARESRTPFSKASFLLKGNRNLEALRQHRKNVLSNYEIKDLDIRLFLS